MYGNFIHYRQQLFPERFRRPFHARYLFRVPVLLKYYSNFLNVKSISDLKRLTPTSTTSKVGLSLENNENSFEILIP